MKLILKVDPDSITLDDLVMIEEGNVRARATRDLVARFVVDEAGQPVPEEEAQKTVGKLTLREMITVGQQLRSEIERLMGSMVPPVSAPS